jgi:hypothetical protein
MLWIQRFRETDGGMAGATIERGLFVGDHDKPIQSRHLKDAEYFLFRTMIERGTTNEHARKDTLKHIRLGFLQLEEVESMARDLVGDDSPDSFGSLVRSELEKMIGNESVASPTTLGLSILHAGQVIPSIVIGLIARQLLSDVLIVWGGPHISGIGKAAFQHDLQQRRLAADIFVAGHAEETFADILDDEWRFYKQSFLSGKALFLQGKGGMVPYAPTFDNLPLYDQPPVLPAQSTLGCAYGRCAFCTYPKMEPVPRKLDLALAIEGVVEQAQALGGTVALKDSLVTPKRLKEVAELISGRVKWSACTKLHPKLLDIRLLEYLAVNGLATLEVGLESLIPETQRRVAKEHPKTIFEDFLLIASRVSCLCIVVNYITGFPWEDKNESQAALELAQEMVEKYLGDRGKVEHNTFELERQSPMAQSPEKFEIDAESLVTWPWASVVLYERK